MEVHCILLKQESGNVRSCTGRICPRPKQLSSGRNFSASRNKTANTANHANCTIKIFPTSYRYRPEAEI
jgi:hypothetical protein